MRNACRRIGPFLQAREIASRNLHTAPVMVSQQHRGTIPGQRQDSNPIQANLLIWFSAPSERLCHAATAIAS